MGSSSISSVSSKRWPVLEPKLTLWISQMSPSGTLRKSIPRRSFTSLLIYSDSDKSLFSGRVAHSTSYLFRKVTILFSKPLQITSSDVREGISLVEFSLILAASFRCTRSMITSWIFIESIFGSVQARWSRMYWKPRIIAAYQMMFCISRL